MTASPPIAIRHDADRRRFVIELEGERAELAYRLDGHVMVIEHTGVPEAIGGRGIAGQLVRAALDHARAQDWKVELACSYSAAYVQRHPQYADLVVG